MLVISIFLATLVVFSLFIIYKQEQTIKFYKSQSNQHKRNSDQNFLFFQKAEEKNKKAESEIFNLKIELSNRENLIINLHAEIKNIKQLLNNN
jgi:molecular chaperone GrpE (heat shock protein)